MLHRTVGRYVGRKRLLHLFNSCVLPIMDYCDVVATPKCDFAARKLERAQNFCMRCISRRFDYSAENLYDLLGLCPLKVRRDKHLIIFFFKVFKRLHFVPNWLFRVKSDVPSIRTMSTRSDSTFLGTLPNRATKGAYCGIHQLFYFPCSNIVEPA